MVMLTSVVDALSDDSWLLMTSLVRALEQAANVNDATELAAAHSLRVGIGALAAGSARAARADSGGVGVAEGDVMDGRGGLRGDSRPRDRGDGPQGKRGNAEGEHA